MTAPKRKTVTDPGPFGHKSAPMHERLPSSELDTDPDPEVDDLYRFREISVSPEMREEFLQAKLPLAKPDQLLDTRPPSRALSGEDARVPLDRNAPTEPALGVHQSHESEVSEDSYSRSAPTLLNARRRRGRYRRMVAVGIVLALGLLVWVVARSRSPAPQRVQVDAVGAAPARTAPVAPKTKSTKSTHLEIEEQPSESAPDSTSEPPDSKNPPSTNPARGTPRPATAPTLQARTLQTKKAPVSTQQSPVPTQQTEPSAKREAPAKKKSFDPEELIF